MYENTNKPSNMGRIPDDAYQDVRPFILQWNGRDYTICKTRKIYGYQEGQTFFEILEASDGIETFLVKLSALEVLLLCAKK